LGEIEDHLKITIAQVGPEMNVPMDEFDGKVTYGEKRKQRGLLLKIQVSSFVRVIIIDFRFWLQRSRADDGTCCPGAGCAREASTDFVSQQS